MTEQDQYLESVLHPAFIEREGSVLFAGHLTKELLESQWKQLLRHDPERAERTINHIHLGDLSDKEAVQLLLGQRIQLVWFETLDEGFPDREFSIALTRTTRDGEVEWLLDLWTHRRSEVQDDDQVGLMV